MEKTHPFFATPLDIQANCFYAHYLKPDGDIEQVGFSENFIHLTTLSSDDHPYSWFQENEKMIASEQYHKVKLIIQDFFDYSNQLLDTPSLSSKATKVQAGNAYIYNNRLGKILSITEGRACFGGFQRNNDKHFSAFMTFLDLKDFETNEVHQIETSVTDNFETKLHDVLEQIKQTLCN